MYFDPQPARLFRAAGLIRMPRAPKLKFEAFLLLVSWEFEAPCTRIDLSSFSAAGGQVYLSKEEVGERKKEEIWHPILFKKRRGRRPARPIDYLLPPPISFKHL